MQGGTLVNITGNGFSTDCAKNKVRTNEVECKIETCSSNSITCVTQMAFNKHYIDNTGVSSRKRNIFKKKLLNDHFK